MRILWVRKGYWDEATDRATWVEMTRALEARGHQVTILTGYRRRRDAGGLRRVVFVRSISRPYLNHLTQTLALALALGRELRAQRPEVTVVDALGWWPAAPYAVLGRLGVGRTRFVLDVRTLPVDGTGLKGRLEALDFALGLRLTARFYDGLTVITPYLAGLLRSRFDLRLPMETWSSGVSPQRFDPAAVSPTRVARIRAEAGVPAGGHLLLYHGSYGRYRGLDNLVRAMALVRQADARCVLLLLGDGPSAADLRRLIDELDLEGAVILHDPAPYDEAPAYIAAASLGVLPFPRLMWWRVSSPLKLMEYMAMATPVVVTRIEAHHDVLGMTPSAFYAPDGTPASLAEAIMRALSALALEPDIGRPLRDLAATGYSWDAQADRLDAFLRRVVRQGDDAAI